MSVFNGTASDIEDNRNKVSTIDKNSTDKQYPSAKAVYNAMQSVSVDYSLVANALKGTASGEVVAIKDVSPLPHTVLVKASGGGVGEALVKVGEAVSYETVPDDVDINVSEYVALNELHDFDVNICGAYVHVDLDNLYYHVYPFSGASTGLLLSNGSTNYVLYTTDQNGGDVYCYIDGTTVYLDVGNGIETYQVAEGTKIKLLCCYGEGFNDVNDNYTQTIDVYGCSYQSGTTVNVCGKNLFDISKVVTLNLAGYDYKVINNGDGTITVTTATQTGVSANAPNTLRDYAPNLKVGETYFLSANSTPVEGSSYANNYIYLSGTGANVTWMFNDATKGKLKITEDLLNAQVLWYAWGKKNATTTISNIQIEKGKTATEYEAYREPVTYAVDGDGEVTVPSQYPAMIFIPDTEGVELSVEYNRDINKAFAELQAAIISMGGNV